MLKNPVATLGADLTLPFLDIAKARLNTRIAGTRYEIAATRFRTTLYTTLGEVDNALSAREQLAAQVESARRSYQAARDIERMYEVRYRAGAADLRTWLDAQQTLRESELQGLRPRTLKPPLRAPARASGVGAPRHARQWRASCAFSPRGERGEGS